MFFYALVGKKTFVFRLSANTISHSTGRVNLSANTISASLINWKQMIKTLPVDKIKLMKTLLLNNIFTSIIPLLTFKLLVIKSIFVKTSTTNYRYKHLAHFYRNITTAD